MGENGYGALQQALVDAMVEGQTIRSGAVEAAFRAVPRHLFVPDSTLEEAYQNRAIPTKRGDRGLAISSSSQPGMMAIMLEQLGLEAGQHVLEVGAGTGFNAALMGHIVGAAGRVTTIDIDLDIVEAAREHLAAAGCSNVTVVCGDGVAGFAENGPYDAVILTVGGWDIAPAWLEQLKPDGRLVLPLSLNGPQFSIAFERQGAGLVSRSIFACGFMALRGEHAEPTVMLAMNEAKDVNLAYEADPERPRQIEAGQVAAWLGGVGEDTAVGLRLSAGEVWRGLNLWMALNEPDLASLGASREAVGTVPALIRGEGNSWSMTNGLVGKGGLALFVRPSFEPAAWDEGFELFIRGFGRAEGLVERLRRRAIDWDENGRPGTEGMRVRVYPVGWEVEGIVVQGRWFQFVVDWVEEGEIVGGDGG